MEPNISDSSFDPTKKHTALSLNNKNKEERMVIKITDETLGVPEDDIVTIWGINDIFMIIVAIGAFISFLIGKIIIRCKSKRRKDMICGSDDNERTVDMAEDTTCLIDVL